MAKHKYIETPENLWELFIQYKQWVKANPFRVTDWVGGMAKEVVREKERPLTMEGFSLWLFQNKIITEVWQYFSNLNNAYTEYLGICSRIKETIREDQIAGGMAGIYNPSITQRLNGLTEKIQEDGSKEVTIKVKYDKGSNAEPTA